MNRAGRWQSCTMDVSSNNTVSAACDLGGMYDGVVVQVPTVDAAVVSCQVARGDTFKDLYVTDPADGAENKVALTSGTGDFMWHIPAPVETIRFVSDNAQSGDVTFYARGIQRMF